VRAGSTRSAVLDGPALVVECLAVCAAVQSLSFASLATRSGRSSWARIASPTAIADVDHEKERGVLTLSGR